MPTRRLLLVLCSVLLVGSCSAPEEPTRPPNVLFIVVDDLNVAQGTYGDYITAKTPNIDRLASQGIRFDRAYAQDPVCNPSRSSFLSGRRPPSTQVYGNFTEPRHHMGDVVMLPEHFRNQGYFTARVGKVAHGRYEDSVTWDISENAWRDSSRAPWPSRSSPPWWMNCTRPWTGKAASWWSFSRASWTARISVPALARRAGERH